MTKIEAPRNNEFGSGVSTKSNRPAGSENNGRRAPESGTRMGAKSVLSREGRPYRLLSGGGQSGEPTGDLRDDRVPMARCRLSEQTNGRVPGAVGAVEQPAPIRSEGQHDPDRPAHRARHMGEHG